MSLRSRISSASKWAALADKARHSETDFPDSPTLENARHSGHDTWDPDACVKLLRMPSVHNYSGLKKILSQCDAAWMTEFLELSGLEVLFESLERLTRRQSSSIEDAVLQLNCVECLRAIMNSQTGLDYIVGHSKYTRKLAETLDTKNTVLKKQVFELLSAVCVYAPKGHDLAIDALEHYKTSQNKRYRFALLVEELKQAEVLPYAAVVLGFINCIIISTDDIRQRLRIRNEFAGLGLLDLVSSLRNAGDDEVFIQCHVFETTKHADDEEALSRGLLASISHHELFVSILDKVYSSPQCLTFLMVLQNLNRLNPDDISSDLAWELLERVSDKLASSPVVPFYNAVGETLDCNFRSRTETSVATQTSSECETDSMDARRRLISLGSDIGGDEVFVDRPAAQRGGKLNIFKFISHVSSLTRSRSFRANKMQQAPECKSIKPASPVILRRRTLETSSPSTAPKCTQKSPHATRVTKQSQANETRPQFPQSSPRSTQLTRSATLKAQTSPSSKRKRPPEPTQKESTIPAPRPSGVQPAGPPGPLNGPVVGPAAPPAPPAPPPPPPPPPPPACNSPPPPPPPPPMTGGPKTPPPPPLSPLGDGLPVDKLSKPGKLPGPFHTLPKPQHKMKTLNWTKVPDTLVCGGRNIWSDVTREAEKEDVENSLNFKQVEELFCQKAAAPAEQKAANEKAKKEPAFISLLDGKRSLNVCIFLKQFKHSPEAIVDLIRNCKSKDIGAERLRMLQKILPEPDELTLLQTYTGDRSKLGSAEQFFLLLGELKLYALYVDGLLQMEEFQPSVEAIKPQLDNYTTVCQEILTNKSLKEFLKLILITGNFINSGSYAGNAFGFRLNTLPKLLETRANKPRMTLLHYLVETAEKTNSNMLTFTKDLKHLAQCSRLSLDGIRTDMKQLTAGITKLERHLKTASKEFKEQFGTFVERAKSQLNDLNSRLLTISELSDRLADHFCEEKSRFSVEECLHIFNNFCEKVKLALKENEERRLQEERAERLRSSRPISNLKNGRKKGSAKPPAEEECLVDRLLAEIRQGSFKLRRTTAIGST